MLLSSGSRLAQIVEALLAHRRDSIRKPEAFDLHTMLDELFYELQPQPIADGVFLHKAYAQRPITMIGDRLTLQRAIGNLMKNALEAMQGLTGRRCLQLTTSCRDGVLQLAIADTGPGMTAELMSRVMEGGHTEGKLDGNGIGMQVVNEAIAQHQGALRCDSERGAGTTFHITLPIIVAKSQEIADMHKTSEKRETIPTPGRILWNPPRVKAAIKHSA
jgi:two-component system, cell cycle sensor histidine kinase and response regulator CckA